MHNDQGPIEELEPDAKMAFLRSTPIFQGLPEEMISVISGHLDEYVFHPGDTVFSQGDPADGLYLVTDGELELRSTIDGTTRTIARVGSLGTLGNITRVGQTERFSTAIATTHSHILFLGEAQFSEVARSFAKECETVINRVGEIWQSLLFARFLRFSPPFNGLGEDVLAAFEQESIVLPIDRGTIVARRGEKADAIFVVVNGRLRNWFPQRQDGTVLLRELGPRSMFGNIEMLGQRPYEADIRAVRDSVIAKISRPSLETLLKRFPLVINDLLSRSLIRQIDNNEKSQKPRNTTKTFALVPTTARVPIVEIGNQLAETIAAFGQTRMVDSAACDSMLGVTDAAQSPTGTTQSRMLQNWLSQQEFTSDFTLYVADPDVTNWTRHCAHQADHILFVASTEESPGLGEIEGQILDEENLLGVRKSLVLVHPEETDIPAGTNDWLTPRQLAMHHHLRFRNKKDMGRLARVLVGRAVALVMGGGGARGFAHVGVMRVFEELGIPVDMVGGTSMGALIGAQYAMQWSGDTIIERSLALAKGKDRLTIPAVSLYSGEVFSAGLERMFGQGRIEDLWRRYFCVSCNLTRGHIQVHDRGPLAGALLASNAPPGLLPPYSAGTDLLVDGGLLNNLPVDIMQRYNEGGLIVAIDVSPREDLHVKTDTTRGISGVKVLAQKLNPFSEDIDIPGVYDIILRSMQIGGLERYRRVLELADLYLAPPVSDYRITAHMSGLEIADRAYGYAKAPVRDWWDGVNAQKQTPR